MHNTIRHIMPSLIATACDAQGPNNKAYDRFLKQGHIEALTLGVFFPALILADAWLLLNRMHYWHQGVVGELLLPLGAVISTFIACSYGFIGLLCAGQSAIDVLKGKISWQLTVVISAAAYIAITFGLPALYSLTHIVLAHSNRANFSLTSIILIVYSLVLAPVSEEIAFQAYIQTKLRRFGAVPAVVMTSLLFTLCHATILTTLPNSAYFLHFLVTYFPILVIYAIVRELTGSLLSVIVLHSANNLTTTFASLIVK